MTEEPLEAAVKSLASDVAKMTKHVDATYISREDADEIFRGIRKNARRQRIQTIVIAVVVVVGSLYSIWQRHHDQQVTEARREAAITGRMNQCLASDHTNEAFRLWVNFLILSAANNPSSTQRDPEEYAAMLKRFRDFTEQSFPTLDCPAIVRGDPIPPLPPLPQQLPI